MPKSQSTAPVSLLPRTRFRHAYPPTRPRTWYMDDFFRVLELLLVLRIIEQLRNL
jgi:hypothetical protein